MQQTRNQALSLSVSVFNGGDSHSSPPLLIEPLHVSISSFVFSPLFSLFSCEDVEYKAELQTFLVGEEAEWNLHNVLDEAMRDKIFKSKFRTYKGRALVPNESEKLQCQKEMMKVSK